MAVVSPSEIVIGDTVQFKTLNPHDNVVWTGKIIGIADYNIARQFEDIDTYHQEVVRANPEVDIGDKTTLVYWLLSVSENNTVTTTRVFATAYIDTSTLERVSEVEYAIIRVYGIDSAKAADLLNEIVTKGYAADLQFAKLTTTA